jgi:hypothetical protein
MSKDDLIFLNVWCWYHRRRTWHVLRIDGVPVCLECRLDDIPVLVPSIPEGSPPVRTVERSYA